MCGVGVDGWVFWGQVNACHADGWVWMCVCVCGIQKWGWAGGWVGVIGAGFVWYGCGQVGIVGVS